MPQKEESRESLEYFLEESEKHDEALVTKMLDQEKEIQEKEHAMLREFMGTLGELLKKN